MPSNKKRVFISFAIEDRKYRDFLVAQSRNSSTRFEFTDYSVKRPWDSAWKTNCRTRVRGCDGMIALISENTADADGQLWEIKCAYDEGVPIMLMWINDDRPILPALIRGRRINVWSWDNLEKFIEGL